MNEHDEVVLFYSEEAHNGSYDTVFAIINHVGQGAIELEEREGSLDAQKVDKTVLHAMGERTRGGSDRLKLSLSELDPDERDMIIDAIEYE